MIDTAGSPRKHSVLLAVALGACAPTPPPPALGAPPKEASTTAQANLLLFPEANSEALLGRAVQSTDGGGWTIADARAPGCEVVAVREKASFHSLRKVEAHSMTSLSGGYAKFLSFEASFGRSSTAHIDIENTEILRANLRGSCGEVVVDAVFVGHGKRSIEGTAIAGAGADVKVGIVQVGPSVETARSLLDAVDWKDDQAYGFTFRRNIDADPLEIHTELPSAVTEGDEVKIRFASKQPAWLVVYYLSDGKGDVLWPSSEELEPRVAPGAPAVLPSPREAAQGIKLKAALKRPGTASRETLVVYGFAQQADFDAMKPAVGSERSDGAAYASELTKRLQAVPMSRWSRAVVGYVIQPRK